MLVCAIGRVRGGCRNVQAVLTPSVAHRPDGLVRTVPLISGEVGT